MPRLTVPQLRLLSGREYVAEIKLRLRDDAAWIDMLDPAVVERTRWGLKRMIESLDEQLERGRAAQVPDEPWIIAMTTLRGLAVRRQEGLETAQAPVMASSREARAWRGVAARLAGVVSVLDPAVLDEIVTPYGEPVAQWLAERHEKKESKQ